jgi:hypothetical protein
MAVQTIAQLEKNVSASFGYVKKDLLMLNDAISDINDKIQHLSLNHAALLEKLQKLSEKEPAKKTIKKSKSAAKDSGKKEISFYDVKTKKRFKTGKYSIRVKGNRRFAVATSPSGIAAWRILGSVEGKKGSVPKRIVKETIEYA